MEAYEDDIAQILKLATETRVDRSRWSDYLVRAGDIARRMGLSKASIEDLPLMPSSRAAMALRRAVVHSLATRTPLELLASAERGEF
ncbi:MAG: hypothetical protein ABL982_08275 [Vicinamibacterales bacterium]